MIDRYAIFSDFKDINHRYGLEGEEFTVPNYNASPSQQLPIVSNLAKKEISFFYWGLNKKWSNNKSVSPKLLTLNSETLSTKSAHRKLLMEHRCLIPANGFYLWKQYGKRRKTPHYFKEPSEEIISLAGIWEEFEDMEGQATYTFKIIERPNYTGIAEFDNFLPAVIKKEDEKKWLDSYSSEEELMSMILNNEATKSLANHPVSPHISNPKLNSAELIKPQQQVDQLGNYTLFD